MFAFFLAPVAGFPQFVTSYPDIPRIDVHTHAHKNYETIRNYLLMRDMMLSGHQVNLAMWINLGGESAIDTIYEVSQGRILTCISDYGAHKGMKHKPEDMAASLERGYAGYKIWHRPYSRVLKEGEEDIKYFDDPAHEPVLSAMEKEGMPGASIHIADPNRPFWDRGEVGSRSR